MRNVLKKFLIHLLTFEARLVVLKYKPRIVAVTGSVGKTATKDALYAIIAAGAHTRKSQKSFNSEVGVPLTILGLPNAWNNPLRWIENLLKGLLLYLLPHTYPQWLVLEVGADRPGDISSLASWLPVDIAVITRLPDVPVHVEFFDSPKQVVEEKASLIQALKPGGTLVLYADEENVHSLKERAKNARVITFGFSTESDVRGEDVRILQEEGKEAWPIGMSMKVSIGGEIIPIEIAGALGAHALLPALAAAAAAQALGKNTSEIIRALESYEPPLGRMHLVPGVKDTLIIDDTYNSSPAAVLAALETLQLIKKYVPMGRQIVVLGDMMELGRHSVEEHRKIGGEIKRSADILLTVGFRARDIAGGALDSGMQDRAIFQFEDAQQAGKELEQMLRAKDVVLIKGSQSMRMERIVEEIMQEPERAVELLVRQDEEWRAKR